MHSIPPASRAVSVSVALLSSVSVALASRALAVDLDVVAPLVSPLGLTTTQPPRFEFDPAASLPLTLAYQAPAAAAPPAPEAAGSEDLAKQLQNPVANLISVPFQFNYDEGFGPKNAGKVQLNIQPVVPISITEDWNLIIRTILPVIYQGSVANGVDDEFGLGDTTQTFFFSPKEPVGGWILGFGPVFLWPSAAPQVLGSGKWGVGPSMVALRQEGPWTFGMLANQIWSYAGQSDRSDVNATFLQPFVSFTFPTATSITLNTESTYDWTGGDWSVPINLMVSQVMRLGGQPVSIQLGGRYWAVSPDNGPEWGLRLNFTLLFPR